jgi:hypothetical protein
MMSASMMAMAMMHHASRQRDDGDQANDPEDCFHA